MQYQTIYSILNDSPRIPWAHVFIGIGAAPVLLFVWKRRDWLFLVLTMIWAVFWNYAILPASWAIYRDHQQCQQALRRGDCQVVEGAIDDFRPMPYTGHSLERFKIQNASFEYSDFDNSKAGFNRTRSHGGPLTGGMHVRLHYREGRILQIQVPTESSNAASPPTR